MTSSEINTPAGPRRTTTQITTFSSHPTMTRKIKQNTQRLSGGDVSDEVCGDVFIFRFVSLQGNDNTNLENSLQTHRSKSWTISVLAPWICDWLDNNEWFDSSRSRVSKTGYVDSYSWAGSFAKGERLSGDVAESWLRFDRDDIGNGIVTRMEERDADRVEAEGE